MGMKRPAGISSGSLQAAFLCRPLKPPDSVLSEIEGEPLNDWRDSDDKRTENDRILPPGAGHGLRRDCPEGRDLRKYSKILLPQECAESRNNTAGHAESGTPLPVLRGAGYPARRPEGEEVLLGQVQEQMVEQPSR